MEWRRGPVIGRGSSAAVSLATTPAGDLFAVKSAEISNSASLCSEQQLISQLSSPFIVKCLGSAITCESDASIYNIFLEYVSGGTLSDLIRDNGGSLDEATISFYAKQMADGLSYLHSVGIVHCDVKGQNMLIGGDGNLKIADFGCAKRLESGAGGFSGEFSGGFAGTPAYMAPEVARGEEQGFAADVWALGCTVVEMATGANPWPEMRDPAAAIYRVAYSGDAPEIPNWLSGVGRDFLERCLTRDPRERWTVGELLQHPFLAETGAAGVRKAARMSPASVMDRGFWDDLEAMDSPTENPNTNPSESDSPAGRIRGLVGDCGSPAPAVEEEEEWVMVRGGVEVGIEGINWDSQNLISEVGDSLFSSNWDGISGNIEISDFENVVGDSDMDDSVPISVAFERMVMKEFFDSDQLFVAFFFFMDLFFAAAFSKHGTVHPLFLFLFVFSG